MSEDGFERPHGPVVVSPKDEGHAIASLEEWLEWAGPLRGAYHWADGRSAKEVARAWLRRDGSAAVPPDLQALLDDNAALGPLRVGTAIPELKTPLGDVPSGPRRHDLVLLSVDGQGRRTLVAVEAKADEPFDAPVAVRIRAARAGAEKAKEANREDRSAQLPRIDRLARALFGRSAFGPDGTTDAVIGTLPYQLLAGLAGTLIEAAARGAEQAVFAVHAFHSDALHAGRVEANDAGFARFLAALPGGPTSIEYGRLHGPLAVPGGEGIPVMPVFLGIATTKLP